MLLQTTPAHIHAQVDKCVKQINYFDGVLECRDVHFWSQSPGVTVGSVHIRVREDVKETAVLNYANGLLKNYITHLTVQIVKDSWMLPDAIPSPTSRLHAAAP